ncbi:MAG: hypothetical protein KDJ65_40760, partial [Anaerolineae bacterium]|nr:hypothetical protein [Anaerolineae bacterium]
MRDFLREFFYPRRAVKVRAEASFWERLSNSTLKLKTGTEFIKIQCFSVSNSQNAPSPLAETPSLFAEPSVPSAETPLQLAEPS